MTGLPALGTFFLQPGFRGQVIGHLSGMTVMEATLDGSIAAHTADHDELAIVIEGEIRLVIDGTERILRAGDSAIVGAGALHEVEATRSSRLLIIG